MRLVFSLEAAQEFADAERYYESQFPRLGAEFRTEVHAALTRIRTWPLAFPVERDSVRRAMLARFPYKLMYSVEPALVYVIAIAHQHRKPDYWTGREGKT